MDKQLLEAIAEDLRAGKAVELSPADFPCFSAEETEGNPYVSPESLKVISANLSAMDAVVFERAVAALKNGEIAWIGFKLVWDAEAACKNTDNEVTKTYGDQGSADGEPMVFFATDEAEIVAAREYSPRDEFQMTDVTRGPRMHTEQFEGLTWVSVPLFAQERVWILGAGDVASKVAELAHFVDFDVVVCDHDPAYLNEERFPHAQRILFDNHNYDDLFKLTAGPGDYLCILTRGHVFDPEACMWALSQPSHYLGMMGCKEKNDTVYDIIRKRGVTDEEWARIKRPIGLKFGARAPGELALSVVAELVDVRYHRRYSAQAREYHDRSLGLV